VVENGTRRRRSASKHSGRRGEQMRLGRGAGGQRWGVAPFYRVGASELKRSVEAGGWRSWRVYAGGEAQWRNFSAANGAI
jgi:hypothetical protein